MKIALGIEYDGSLFHGWQKQPKLRTVQSCLEPVLSKVANHPVETICAGRTDTGVHAFGQVVHFETHSERKNLEWILGANSQLDKDIRVKFAKPVADDFHARFSAIARTYQYVIYNSSTHPALFRNYVTWYRYPLDADLMQQGANYLLGKLDFNSFRSSICQSKSAIRIMHAIDVKRKGDLITLTIRANAFLHHMVRNIMGVLLAVGTKKYPPQWVETVLLAKDRSKALETALPTGLALMEVEYPAEFDIPRSNDLSLVSM